ncbi:MAG: sugar ABC transporter permease [Opitutaceae bacterium]|jgi:multiple sugar transport system permease protein|nr:sugar ABC transporter permease [Opitutaceae bacterium]
MNNRRALHLWFWLFAGPAVLGFAAFSLLPMLESLWLSFCRYDIVNPPEFVGLKNYHYVLTADPAFWPAVKVTAIFALANVPVALATALLLAMLLAQPNRFQGFYRSVFFLPSLLPQTASVAIFAYIFNPDGGLLNTLLARAGVEGPAWTSSTTWALPTLLIISLWGFGHAMLIMLGAVQSVPRDLYEAAHLDGAGVWGRFRHVTLPMISPVLFFNLVMGVIGALKVFDLAYAFGAATGQTPGGPARATLFYGLHLYQKAFNYFHLGPASAMAWLLFAVILALTAFNFLAAKRWVHYER